MVAEPELLDEIVLPEAPASLTEAMGVEKDKEMAILLHESRFTFT